MHDLEGQSRSLVHLHFYLGTRAMQPMRRYHAITYLEDKDRPTILWTLPINAKIFTCLLEFLCTAVQRRQTVVALSTFAHLTIFYYQVTL